MFPGDPRLTPAELEEYLHRHIPLSKAMQAGVRSASGNEVVLAAPLAPNINHRETVFGGSASTLAILASWSLLHVRMREESLDGRLVIQRNTMEYDLPIAGSFLARSRLADPDDWPGFARMFSRRGRARITVSAVLEYEDGIAGRFSGEFVALGR